MRYTTVIPQNVIALWEKLLAHGYDTYLVGGAVRDMVMNKVPVDFDLATSATPEQIRKVFHGHKFDHVGVSFGVSIVDDVEISTFRLDSYYGGGDKDVEIRYAKTLEEDLARRDLTINAMAMDIEGWIIDPHGGLDDLQNRRIVFVGNPALRIQEDPNRILRACRFTAAIDGTIPNETLYALRNAVIHDKMLDRVAPERIGIEVKKAMQIKKASRFWRILILTGCDEYVIPELKDGIHHDHGKYHNEDIFEHNMIAGDSISTRFPLVKLGAYLHDVGKPASYNSDDRSFKGHQNIGADIVRNRLTEMKFSSDEIRKVVNLVLIHMDGTRKMSSKARRRLKNKLDRYGLDWREYLRLRIADRKANLLKPDFTRYDVLKYIENLTKEEIVPLNAHHLALSGGDIIKELGIPPGPIVGQIQKELLQFVIDEGDKWNDRDYLLGYAQGILQDITKEKQS